MINPPSSIFVTPPRLERGTYSLEGCCSIQLSYGAIFAQLMELRQNPERLHRFDSAEPEDRATGQSSLNEWSSGKTLGELIRPIKSASRTLRVPSGFDPEPFDTLTVPNASTVLGTPSLSRVSLEGLVEGFRGHQYTKFPSASQSDLIIRWSVGARGFEPPTSCSQSKRSNRAELRPEVNHTAIANFRETAAVNFTAVNELLPSLSGNFVYSSRF